MNLLRRVRLRLGNWGSRRLVWRMARRATLQSKGRTVAILLAVALPLFAVVAVSTATASARPSLQAETAELMGDAATLVIHPELPEGVESWADTIAAPPDWLSGSAVVPEVVASGAVTAGENQVETRLFGVDLADPLMSGRVQWVEGRAPSKAGEIALSTGLAPRLDVEVGDEVRVGIDETAMLVTGVVTRVSNTTDRMAVTTAEQAADLFDRRAEIIDPTERVNVGAPPQIGWFTAADVQVPDTAETWRSLPRERARAIVAEPEPFEGETQNWVVGGAILVLAEVALVIFAVFTVVARRSRRMLALLAAAGAPPTMRRAVVAAQGGWLGLGAVAIAVPAGIAAGTAAAGPLAASRNQIAGDLAVSFPALLAVVVLGVGVCWFAARLASRQVGDDVMAALADRPQPQTAQQRSTATRWAVGLTIAALAAMFVGVSFVGLPALVAAVLLLVAAGLARVQPLLARLSDMRRSTVAATIGTRLSGRAGGRAVGVTAVVGSLVALTGMMLTGFGGLAARAEATYQPQLPDGAGLVYATRVPADATLAAMSDDLDDRPVVPLQVPAPPRYDPALTYWGVWAPIVPDGCQATATVNDCDATAQTVAALIDPQRLTQLVDDPDTLERLQGHLRNGGAVVTAPPLITNGTVTLQAPKPNSDDETTLADLPAMTWDLGRVYPGFPGVLMGAAGLEALGGEANPNEVQLYIPAGDEPITTTQQDQSRATLAADIQAGYFNYNVERGSEAARIVQRGTVLAAGVLLLVVLTLSAVTVVLVSTDLRADLSSLAAAGADQRRRGAMTAHHALILTAVGCAIGLGVVALTVPAVVIVMGADIALQPWLWLVGICLVAIGAAWTTGLLGGRRITTVLRRAE